MRYQSGCSALPALLWCTLLTRSTPRLWKAHLATSAQNSAFPVCSTLRAHKQL